MKKVLEARGVCAAFGSLTVVQNVDLDLAQSEQLFILGRSGSGKTTFSRCLLGLQKTSGGTIRYFDRQGTAVETPRGMPPAGLAAAVFQGLALFPHLRVIDNITLAQRLALKRSAEKATATAREWLERLGIGDLAGKWPSQISGGQAQRVAIARALAINPSFVVFDEPTSALDPDTTEEFAQILKTIRQQGVAIIIVTHDIHFVMKNAQRVLVLERGHATEFADLRALTEQGPGFVLRYLDGFARGVPQAH